MLYRWMFWYIFIFHIWLLFERDFYPQADGYIRSVVQVALGTKRITSWDHWPLQRCWTGPWRSLPGSCIATMCLLMLMWVKSYEQLSLNTDVCVRTRLSVFERDALRLRRWGDCLVVNMRVKEWAWTLVVVKLTRLSCVFMCWCHHEETGGREEFNSTWICCI